MINKSKIRYNGETFKLEGKGIQEKETRAKDLAGYFSDTAAYQELSPETVMYRVEYQDNDLVEGTPGGLYFGITHLYPGVVGAEYFLTKGHFHAKRDTGEYYFGLEGQGLLMMTDNGETQLEEVVPGSVHYIPGNTAHRLINTGATLLSVSACWQTESGHDYAPPEEMFPQRVLRAASGEPVIKIND
ncbi:glucose-6-phosphate isomerase family protein [Enterococcus sp. DIV0187]|uniref:glucose-6-phosphate isomerase family protein n=1 Tax=Enterococcus sp. DIV0187 TaxID=2774644 RepID=UPI003F1EB030